MRLQHKVVVITGAASGMGRAGAIRFAAEGASVVVADIDDAGAEQVASQIVEGGGTATAMRCDVSAADDNERAVALAQDTYGGLDVFWANAGVAAPFRPITEIDPAEFERLLAVNTRAPWLGARAALPALRARGGGSLLLTASLSGLKGRADASAYQTSKGGAVMLVRSLAREFGPHNIRVNSVCPVAAETAMWPTLMAGYRDPDDAAREFAEAIPLGRLATPEDVAAAALFFASDDSAFVSGVNLAVDGGSLA